MGQHTEDPHYGDNTFSGHGKLRCAICNGKLVDHPVARPCPFRPGDREARLKAMKSRRDANTWTTSNGK